MNLELKYEMNKVSDFSLHGKIYNLFSEADTPNKNDFQLSHLSYMMGIGTDPDAIKKTGTSVGSVTDMFKLIDTSNGDITKMKDIDTIVKVLNATKLICDATSKSKNYEQAQDIYDVLLSSKDKFQKGYKNNSFFVIMIYRTMILDLYYQCSILASAGTIVLTAGDDKNTKSIDDVINATQSWKEIFDKSKEMMDDKDLKRAIDAGSNISLKAEAVEMYAESIANLVSYYSEVSLQDVALVVKLGLAKFAYKLCGILRFFIYISLYTKYSFERRVTEMKAILAFSEKDLNQKMLDEDKLNDNIVAMRVDDIKVISAASKDSKELKIKEIDENRFDI